MPPSGGTPAAPSDRTVPGTSGVGPLTSAGDVVSEHLDAHAVQVHISNLRRKLEPDPGTPRYLVTVKGLGYKLRA